MERNAIHDRIGTRGAFAARALLPLLAVLALLLATGCQTGEPVTVGLEWKPAYEVQQSTGERCWAACAAMAHRYLLNDRTTEEEIVARVRDPEAAVAPGDAPADETAGRLKVITALVPDAPNMEAALIEQTIGLLLIASTIEDAGARAEAESLIGKLAADWTSLMLTSDWNGVVAGLAEKDAAGKVSPAVLALKPMVGYPVGHIVVLVDVTARPVRFLQSLYGKDDPRSLVDWKLESLHYFDPQTLQMGELKGAEVIDDSIDFVINVRQASQRLAAISETVDALLANPHVSALLLQRYGL